MKILFKSFKKVKRKKGEKGEKKRIGGGNFEGKKGIGEIREGQEGEGKFGGKFRGERERREVKSRN